MSIQTNKIKVTTSVDNKEVIAGTLFSHGESTTFVYDDEYISLTNSYDLFPSLQRTAYGPFHFSGIGPFSDSSPDRWGRTLIKRTLKRNRVSEIEYLLNVDDEARQGSIRYYIDNVVQTSSSNIPLVVDLPKLLTIADNVVMQNDITDADAAKLFHATGSLGGARPKACVRDGNKLFVAKFPKPTGDRWDVIGWEYVSLILASEFGISVPKAKKICIKDNHGQGRNIMLTQRFDRDLQGNRIHYMSAMTALHTSDGEGGDWQDLCEITMELGGNLYELWKRALFGTAIGNIDNHLRNHAFLIHKNQWELSPVFDINPEPIDNAADTYQLALFGEREISIKAFTDPKALDLFGITEEQCKQTLQKLEQVLRKAVSTARKSKIDAKSIEIIAPRFERSLNEI